GPPGRPPTHPGLPLDLHTSREGRAGSLAFRGRISPEKRVDRPIEVARRPGLPLRIAAKVDPADREYFKQTIEPLLARSRDLVEFIGEVGGAAKDEFLGNALGLLFPIDWPGPFGLGVIEAPGLRTPAVAYRSAAVPR